MAKVTMPQVYRQIWDRNEENLQDCINAGKEATAYDFSTFDLDLRANDLLSSDRSIKEKWRSAVADGVIEVPASCKPYTKAILWVGTLQAKVSGRNSVRARVCVRVNATDCHGKAEGRA